jgi:putative ABC transport system permease protein
MRQLLATLRHRPAPLVGTFVALVAAALVVTWAFSLGESGRTSEIPAQRLAGTAVVVMGNPKVALSTGGANAATTNQMSLTSYRRVPATLATTLRPIRGVRAVVADQSVPLALRLPGGRVVTGTNAEPTTGYGWQSAALTPFRLRFGHAPKSARQLVIGAGLAKTTGLGVGDQLSLAGQQLGPFTVVGIAAAPAGDLAGNGTVFFSESEATALYGHPGQADLIGIVAQPGTSPTGLAARVRAALSGWHLSVLTGRARGAAENLTAESDLANLSGLGSTGGIFVLISLFVVASTVALSVAEGARTMALLRAVGATPGQIRRMVMAELAVLGTLAGLVGYLPGTWLASYSVKGLAAHQLVPDSARPWTSPVELIPSVLFGIAIAELSGLFAARRASRMRPAAALQEAGTERRYPRPLRLVLGLGAIGAGVVFSVIALDQPDASRQLNQAQLVLLAFMAGVALLGPYLMTLAEVALRLPLRLVGRTPGRLASAQIRARSRRMAAGAVAIALPITFAGAILLIDATQIHGSDTESRQRLAASGVVTAPGPGLDPSVLTAIRAQPHVTGAIALIPTIVYVPYAGGLNASAEGVTPGPLDSLLRLDVTSGSLAHFGPGDVAVSALIGGKGGMNAHIGETITTYLADGTPYRATVAAVYSRSLGFADVLVPTGAAGGGHLGTTAFDEVLVGASPSTNPTTLSEEIASLSNSYSGLRVANRSVANAQDELLNSQTSYANDLLIALIGLLAAVALANTLVMATLQGRDELTLLRRVGTTLRQLLAMTAWEAAEVTVVGVLLGAAAAAAAVTAVSKALTGSRMPYLAWEPVAVILGLVVALTALAVFAPTARMLSQEESV